MSDREHRGDLMIRLEGIHKTFERSGQEPVHALSDINLDVARNEFVTLIGPSGCGKTTLLRSIAGLVEADSGQIVVDGDEIEGTSADRAMVFQSFALLPWATVLENISFGLLLRKDPKKEREEVARELAGLVGLSGFEDTRPAELSGGMQQRVGLARALAVRPKVLLMDEPFGSLDEQTKRVMQDVLLDIWERDKTTVVFVTHSIDEAVFLADRVVMMSPRPGRISRIVDVPLQRPRTRAVERSSEFVEMRTSLWEDLLSSREPTLAESE